MVSSEAWAGSRAGNSRRDPGRDPGPDSGPDPNLNPGLNPGPRREKKSAGRAVTELLGSSPAVVALRGQITRFALAPWPVLVEGESGVGKELVAGHLHQQSRRAACPYLKINCAALPAELLEAQLFGHVRGAFTGAVHSRAGFLGAAGEGSLLLDELGELPLELQSKLLRVLDDGEYHRLGETRPRCLRARIIASTNRPLRPLVQAGHFRSDLYYRLSVLRIEVPALRERGADVLLLFEHFVRHCGGRFWLDRAGRVALERHRFPGNVRELRNLVIRLGARELSGTVDAATLALELEPELEPEPGELSPALLAASEVAERRQEMLRGEFQLWAALGELERRCILEALQLSAGNLSLAARLLGLPRTTLYGRLRQFSIPSEE